jgi:glycosyltransferase involved in cell wall biosynthesis
MTPGMPTPPAEHTLEPPLFSVVIPTRNRPVLLLRAINSVLIQRDARAEIIVVDDGTDAALIPQLDDIALMLADRGRGRLVHLPYKSNGHGPSFALNFGAASASGSYLCFLDDDDEWTDPTHLARASTAILAANPSPDLLFFQQFAYNSDEIRQNGPIWIEDLCPYIQEHNFPIVGNFYPVTATLLMRSPGFSHVNTTIISKELFENIDMFDSTIRYENDRDFYYRAVDLAKNIIYSTSFIARHNIPSEIDKVSASSVVPNVEKSLYQARLGIKAMLFCKTPAVILHAQHHKSYVFKNLTVFLCKSGRSREALQFATEALALKFTFKWMIYTIFIYAMGILEMFTHRLSSEP